MIHINLDKAFSPFGEENIKNDIFDFPSGIESHIKFGNYIQLGTRELYTFLIK